jgi:hypothetical protein
VFLQRLLLPADSRLASRAKATIIFSAAAAAAAALLQAWEGRCGQLDQYGMKQTRLFANLCNAGLQPQALAAVLPDVPCAAAA